MLAALGPLPPPSQPQGLGPPAPTVLSHLSGPGEAPTLENCTGWELLMCILLPASRLAANAHNDSYIHETRLHVSGKDA